jgi:uncharacterized paraquat-inducible protein A
MNLHVLHKVGFVQAGVTPSLSLRNNRRRCCATCRTFISKAGTRCSHCGQRVLTRWHKLLLVMTVLLLSLIVLMVLNWVGA